MGLEVDHRYSIHHRGRFMSWQMYVHMQYACIAHPGPKASEQEQKGHLYTGVNARKN